MTPARRFVDRLRRAAVAAGQAETTYRREAEARIESLAEARAFAFRRANLLEAVMAAVCSVPDTTDDAAGAKEAGAEDIAVARALVMLQARLGWSDPSPAGDLVLAQFAPVAAALFRASDPAADATLCGLESEAALTDFERWYEETHHVAFWTLFETEIAETPVVDF